jgi:hypothetical protein
MTVRTLAQDAVRSIQREMVRRMATAFRLALYIDR